MPTPAPVSRYPPEPVTHFIDFGRLANRQAGAWEAILRNIFPGSDGSGRDHWIGRRYKFLATPDGVYKGCIWYTGGGDEEDNGDYEYLAELMSMLGFSVYSRYQHRRTGRNYHIFTYAGVLGAGGAGGVPNSAMVCREVWAWQAARAGLGAKDRVVKGAGSNLK